MSKTLLTVSRCPSIQRIITGMGGRVEGFDGDTIRVYLPAHGYGNLVRALQLCGLKVKRFYKMPAFSACPKELIHPNNTTLHGVFSQS
jgi:hypothetical protein